MHKFQVFYGKILSPCGVIYVRRGVRRDCLEFSRVYHNLDDDVRRTACLIIEAERRPQGPYAISTPTSLRSFLEIWLVRAFFAWVDRLVCNKPILAQQFVNLLLGFTTALATLLATRNHNCSYWARRSLVALRGDASLAVVLVCCVG
jgi:hypothetical protein